MVSTIELNKRQEHILQIVKENGPITGEHIAEKLNLTRATLRPDLAILTMSGFLEARPRVGYFYTGKTGTQLLADKLKKLQVKDFQSIPVVIHENVSVYDAICTMFLEDVGTLFVVDRDAVLVGCFHEKTCSERALASRSLHRSLFTSS
ncbi:transcriptional repressor CcpN [Bacillus subtilis]|nr:transcriptional repressor CcpN [Bacillus subtilis]